MNKEKAAERYRLFVENGTGEGIPENVSECSKRGIYRKYSFRIISVIDKVEPYEII
jgi:hypothetical protein